MARSVPEKAAAPLHPDDPLVTPVRTEVAHVVAEVAARRPWHSPLLYVGIAMLAVGLVAYGLLFMRNRNDAIAVAVACGMLFAAGKEAAIPIGITAPLLGTPWVIGGSLLWLDAAMSFVIYPFVDAAMRGARKQKGVIGHMVRGARRRADRKRAIVDKYGGVGLFLFMIVPFGFNGPLIAMVVAELVGLGARATLVAVMMAITVTTFAWTMLWSSGFAEALHLPGWVATTIAMSIAAIAITTSIIAGKREKKREEAEALAKLQA